MRRRILIALGLLLPLAAFANPYVLNPSSLVAFYVVAFWAFVVEAGIVSLLLALRGSAPMRLFIAYFIANGLAFFFVFEPLVDRKRLSLLEIELLVVLIDGLAIKLLAGLNTLQGDNYRGVSWIYSVIVSTAGNAASFFVGYFAIRRPWQIE